MISRPAGASERFFYITLPGETDSVRAGRFQLATSRQGIVTGRMAYGRSYLARAQDPFPVPVRTLDGLHLATMHDLRSRRQTLHLAGYDLRFIGAAQALGFPLAHF